MSYHDITCYVQRQLQNVGQHVFTCCEHSIDSQVLVGKHVKTCGNMLNRDDTGYISPGKPGTGHHTCYSLGARSSNCDIQVLSLVTLMFLYLSNSANTHTDTKYKCF